MSNRKQILRTIFKGIALAVVCLAPAGAVYAATCTSSASGNWNAAIWTGCTTPGAADTVVIASGHTVTVNVAAVCTSLSTSGTSSSGVAISAGQSLTVSGNAVLNATSINNGTSKSINVGAGTFTIGGNLTLTNGTGTRTAVLSMSTGTANIGGSLSSGGTLTPGTGTVVFNGAAAQNAGGYTYNNLTVNKSSGTATLTGSATINGNLSVSAGTLDLSTFTANRATAGGAITVAGGATLKIGGSNTFPANYTTRTLAANSVVDYSGSSQTVSNGAPYSHLNLSGSGNKSVGAGLTVNGNLTIGAGTTLLASTFTHNIKGNLGNSGTLTPGSSTFIFDGTSAQSIAGPVSFFNLTLNNAAGITASGAITVQGSFTNTAGFTAETSTVTFGGSSAQSLTGAATFNNLTMNNAAGLTLNNTVAVDGTLTLSSGNITTGANALVINPAGSVTRTSGHVVGNMTKHFVTGIDVMQNFEIGTGATYAPVEVTIATATTAGSMTATTTAADHPQVATASIDSTKSVNRYWTLSKDANLAFDAISAVFNFVSGDIDAGSNTANFIVQRYVAPNWINTTLIAPLATSTEAGNIIALGDFVVGQSLIVGFSHEKEFVFTQELY